MLKFWFICFNLGSTIFTLLPDGKSFKINRNGCAYKKTVEKLKGKWGLEHKM